MKHCPATFFVDVRYPGFPYPMRELVRFSPSSGLVFNRAFSNRYVVFSFRRGFVVDRASSPFLRFFECVRFDGFPASLPVTDVAG